MKNLLKLNQELRFKSLSENQNIYVGKSHKFLLHYPPNGGVKTLMESWALGLNYMGLRSCLFPIHYDSEELQKAIKEIKPTIFITCPDYIEGIDPQVLIDNGVLVGHISGGFGEVPNPPCHFIVDPFLKGVAEMYGVPIHRFKVGANPLIHYADEMGGAISWFYAGRLSASKLERIKEWIHPIMELIPDGLFVTNVREDVPEVNLSQNSEIVAGVIEISEIKKFHSLSLVSLNFHQEDQINYYVDVNERTVIIPACCGFQVVDHPMALLDIFNKDEVVYADSPKEYFNLTGYFVKHPDERLPYIERGMRKVFADYTIFHTMRAMIEFIEGIL